MVNAWCITDPRGQGGLVVSESGLPRPGPLYRQVLLISMFEFLWLNWCEL